MKRWRRPYVYLTILAISQLVATPIAIILFLVFGLAAILGKGGFVSFPIALIALISIGTNLAGAILILLKRTSGLYLDAIGLAIWMFFAFSFGFLYLGFPMIGVPVMIAELILGWRGIRSIAKKVSIRDFLTNKWFIAAVSVIIVGATTSAVILTYGGVQGPFCPPDTTTSIYCAYNYPNSYTAEREVTVTGYVASIRYSPSQELTKELYESDITKGRRGYLNMVITDGNGANLPGALASRGEVHVQLINHVMSLEVGDLVTLSGRITITCAPNSYTKYGCDHSVGWMNVNSVDGIGTSNASLPWTVPDEKKPKWYLGMNLTQYELFTYNIAYSQATESPMAVSEEKKEIRYDASNFTATMRYDNYAGSKNELPFTLEIHDTKNNSGNSTYHCSFSLTTNDLLCSPNPLEIKYSKPLVNSVFYLGRFADSVDPRPLYPFWETWGRDYDYQRLPNQDTEPNRHRIIVLYQNEIHASGKMLNTTVIGWDNAKWWIAKDIPFPISGEVRQTSYYEPNYTIKFALTQMK